MKQDQLYMDICVYRESSVCLIQDDLRVALVDPQLKNRLQWVEYYCRAKIPRFFSILNECGVKLIQG